MADSSETLPVCLQDAGFQGINNTIFRREYQYGNSHFENHQVKENAWNFPFFPIKLARIKIPGKEINLLKFLLISFKILFL
jgi:hypothetical protein